MSIGFSSADNKLDASCYDLLASEARLSSLFAIAKGDLPTRHWFRLGRDATPLGNRSALISWSGSMFEYLMPSLVMRAPLGSLLEQTNSVIVARQIDYGRSMGLPWGVSESAYNARDLEFTYQYSNFGVPGLGLKRGLSDNVVIAPYATGLATMVDPREATRNFERLTQMGASGRYGLHDAIDFTPARLPDGEAFVVVRNFMAHHQGMTIVAIANALQDGKMRARFHREPMIQASELLLQERVPRDIALAHPRAEEVRATPAEAGPAPAKLRRFTSALEAAPNTHLLSNGRYAVMLTAGGGGYSRWRDIAVTRWRDDPTRDDCGAFVFLRDMRDGAVWSPSARPLGGGLEGHEGAFGEDLAVFTCARGPLTTTMEILVSSEHDGEVRQVCLSNAGRKSCEIELTSYAELVLTASAADDAHPAFAKMFVETEYLPDFEALIATRRKRDPGEPSIWVAHFAVVEGVSVGAPQWESSRALFLGRNRTIAEAVAIRDNRPLTGTVGTVLDPVFSLRRRVRVPPGGVARIAYWTLVASSRSDLIDLIDKNYDRSAFERAKTLAWTQAQVQLRHLDVDADEAADFQRLAAPLVCADPRFRATSETIIRGAAPQSGLWPLAISGDLPIVLLRIDDEDDIEQVRQLLRAHEYWRMKRLAVDLVIVNERGASYVQDLQIAIESVVRSSQSRPRFGDERAQGSVFALRADLMSLESRALLLSAARVALLARRGSLSEQLARLPKPAPPKPVPPKPAATISSAPRERSTNTDFRQTPPPTTLEFFNGLGGFDKDGAEYVTVLNARASTPAPWINVIANAAFGFQVSADGGGSTWAENSRDNQLTPWPNDPVADPSGEAIYVRDEVTGEVFAPTAQPLRDGGTYVARHGFGYSRFIHEAQGVALDLLQFVPIADPIKISRLTLRNLSGRTRRLSVTTYVEWVLGVSRGGSGPFIITEIDAKSGAMFARNFWSVAFPGRVAFADMRGGQTSWTGDRREFLGRDGGLAAPAALSGNAPLSGAVGAGLDPCSALRRIVTLGASESVEIVMFVGQCASAEAAQSLVAQYREADLDAAFTEVGDHWRKMLGAVQVKTPDRAMDIMLNGWLLYQTLSCRIFARSAFYQASGAYGFRDQLQDGMALSFAAPEETRAHILRAAGRQFVEGDVQHWWLPHSGQGVRTRISDDRVWLAYAVATYVAASGDVAILNEVIPFIDGPILRPEEHDSFFQPMTSDLSASVFDHCARGLDAAIALTGAHGLPLMGTGDWNDGMNRVGGGGKGESVWLGWLLIDAIARFAPLAKGRDGERARRWRAHAARLKAAIERDAWDGEWYRRATFDDGTWLGAKANDECRIDSIAQTWAVLSGGADLVRAATAMASMREHLVRRDPALALLFAPPFDKTERDPGYIKGYPPGLRENGGQYTHAAAWAVFAFAKLGQGDNAAELFALLNPINHALNAAAVARYQVEPYVMAGDVYSLAPHAGRGGWTWYTGSAAWMLRAGVEGILGIRREGANLVVEPCIPEAWPGFEATVVVASTRIAIFVTRADAAPNQAWSALLDGAALAHIGGFRVRLDGGEHRLCLSTGAA